MGSIKNYIPSVMFLALLVACSNNYNSINHKTDTKPVKPQIHTENIEHCDDTISFILNDVCKEFNELHCYYQVAVPEYYSVIDSLSTTIDNIKHCFIVLEPIDLVDVEYDCKGDKKRKLVHIIIKKGIAQILTEYDNLVSNNGGVSSPFNSISLNNQILEIKHSFGNRYNWDYIMSLNIDKAGLSLNMIKVECSAPEKTNGAEYKYKQLAIKTINIDDTMKINCGCDKYW